MDMESKLKDFVVQAKSLGFDYVDLYVPNGKLVAFTFSTSEKYIDIVSKIEIKEI